MKASDLTGKVLLLLNRTKTPDRWREDGAQALRGVFEDAGYQTEMRFCDDPGEMITYITTATRPGDIVALGVGDGTINAVLDAVITAKVVLIALPMGTANDFARSLCLPDDPIQAAQAAINGQIAHLDIGRVNDKSFVNAASIGVPADARHRINPDLKRWAGALSYAVANWQSWHEMDPLALKIRCNDTTENLLVRQLTITNGQYFGGGLRPRDSKRLDDGKLHMFAIRADVDTLSGMDIAADLLFGSIDNSNLALTRECTDIKIDCDTAHPVLADGEIITHLPARFTLETGILPVFAPMAFTGTAGNRDGLAHADIINDITLDAEDLAVRLGAIRDVAQGNALKSLCHDCADSLRNINRRLELGLRPYDLPTSSPDPDLHSLEELRDRALSWVIEDMDPRLATGLIAQITPLQHQMASCDLTGLPDEISKALQDMAALFDAILPDLHRIAETKSTGD
ncbi:MAG: YegS/Rv2252/BmrU family lipid kinase [Pseudomonadota bacterium]